MIKFIFNKLVRDKTLERMERAGVITHHRILNKTDHIASLKNKLIEESLEVKDASNREEIIKELADLYEVISVLKNVYNITQDEIESAKSTILQERGSFANAIFIEFVEMPEDNPWVKYCRNSPEKYKEVKNIKK